MDINSPNNKGRIYDSSFRKKLMEKFNGIKDKKLLFKIYEVVRFDNEKNISKNKSGVYFNLNKLEDESVKKINDLMINYEKEISENVKYSEEENIDQDKLIYKQYSENDHLEDYDNLGPRLSNQEKSILKKFKTLNENS